MYFSNLLYIGTITILKNLFRAKIEVPGGNWRYLPDIRILVPRLSCGIVTKGFEKNRPTNVPNSSDHFHEECFHKQLNNKEKNR